MRSDQELFDEFSKKHGSARLYPQEKILQLMAMARREVDNDFRSKMPKTDTLKEEFKTILKEVMNNPNKKAYHNGLNQNQLLWAWFVQGAAAVLKRFK